MSLLTALLAFVPGALIARPEPEPESLKAMTESRNRAARRVAELMDELIALRRERDDALARLAVHRILGAQADQQQINQQALSAYLLGGAQQQANLSNQQWGHCTCVPGRYDALRQQRYGEF